jgi:hypothetical protein
VGYLGVAMLAAVRGTPRWVAAGGAAAAGALLTKSTLVVGPLGALVVAVLVDAGSGTSGTANSASRWRRRLRRALPGLGWIALGFASVVAATTAWLALFDSLPGWWYQSFVWPRTFHSLSAPVLRDAGACLARMVETRLIFVLVPAVAGFWLGWRAGERRASAVGATIGALEMVRVLLENGKWPYSLTPMVPALLIGGSLLDRALRGRRNGRLPGLLVPVVCLLPLLAATTAAELQAARYRLVERLPSPSEDLAAAMRRAGYRPSETLFPVTYGIPMFLLLDAPRPYPTLPLYIEEVGPEERTATRTFYRRHPPDWVLQRCVPPRPVRRRAGGIDQAYHVVLDPDPARPSAVEPRVEVGSALSPILSSADRYRLVIDTGEFHVLRLVGDNVD